MRLYANRRADRHAVSRIAARCSQIDMIAISRRPKRGL